MTSWAFLPRFARRFLNRRKPFVCKLCGFEVPIIGTRWDQGLVAYRHMETEHTDYLDGADAILKEFRVSRRDGEDKK